jgi:hypothetical protein
MTRSKLPPAVCLLLTATTGLATETGRFDPAPCEPGQLQVMVVGTYHMSNPGLDSVNMEADDVMSDRRQAEMADLTERLARFAPDKVMLEAAYNGSRVQQEYDAYLSGEYELTRNEIDQIGYRLARRLGHSKVYPVDYPMFMDSTAMEFYEAAHPESKNDGDAIRAGWDAAAKAEKELLLTSTVAEYLSALNSPDFWAFDLDRRYALQTSMRHAQYDQYAGADLLTSWYKRNLRIVTNIHRSVDEGDERVLLLFGAGHNSVLWDLIDTSPLLCRVDPRSYLTD